jgi:uncharacterized protein YfaS (alpha-2-macroglobulin family)
MTHPSKKKIWLMPILLLALILACAMPRTSEPTIQAPPISAEDGTQIMDALTEPTQPPPPTPTPQPLPPDLVEINPPPGSDFPLQGSLTLYFNQPMDRPSVEIALTGEPVLAGRFEWVDDATVTFLPDSPYPPDIDLNITINPSALAINGQFLREPIQLNYHTATPLKVIHLLPEPGLEDVEPTSAIVASFNNPVVPLGIDQATLPDAFTLKPTINGRGEWVNTSTYIYYPDPAMAGGTNYTVLLNPDLQSTAGGPFVGRESFDTNLYEWTFRTALPRLVSIDPGDGSRTVRLDSPFQLVFSQPMEPTSVEENFTLYDPNQNAIPGEAGWNSDFTTLTFTPTLLLARSTSYNAVLLGESRARGGTPLGVDHVARVTTVPALRISTTEPVVGGRLRPNSSVVLHFNGPVEADNPLDYISFIPEVPNLYHWWGDSGNSLYINGSFEPLSTYTATIDAELPDPWDSTLGEAVTYTFSTTSLQPSWFVASGETALTVTPADTTINVQATNIDKIGIRLGSVPFEDFMRFLSPGGYEILQNFRPDDQQSWNYTAGLPGDKSYTIQLPFTRDVEGLAPGIYHLGFFVPELTYQPPPYLIVSSNVHLLFKVSATNAFVWAVDLRTNQPVPGASVSVYDSDGNQITRGVTDAQGIFQSPISTQSDLYDTYYAVLSKPGDEFFSLSLSNWSLGIEGYDFGLTVDFTPPDLTAYIYTDRPIYRPGQTIYFRAILRHEYNGRYALPDLPTIPITIYDGSYSSLETLDLPISEFGTTYGEYTLPESAQPGYYQISTDYGSVPFQVAEYRVPEINLQIESHPAASAGESIAARVDARYFFDAPAGNTSLTWNLYRNATRFHIPGYRVGADEFLWAGPPWRMYTSMFGEFVSSGSGLTDPDGSLTIEFPTEPEIATPQIYTLEATITDESGFPTSTRTEVTVHPADFYIGLRPNTWVGQAGKEIGFEILTVNWDKTPAGVQDLSAKFSKVRWVREDSIDPFIYPTFTPQYTLVSSADFRTAKDGIAQLAFTPPEAGTYQLEVSGQGARTQATVWVGGAGQAIWPNLPNNRLQITADKDRYTPGDIATIFIPNPFGDNTQALVTMERDEVLRHQVMELESSGTSIAIPLTGQDAPNIYVSVTLIDLSADQRPDFRQGYLNIEVTPIEQTLNVELSALPPGDGKHFSPGDEAVFKLHVTDSQGNPIQGEFSLAVVDQAVLALADPNAPDIEPAFYGMQPLGIRTGMSLVVYAQRRTFIPGGMGGGGAEDQALVIRQDFPETAYWNAEVLTDSNGEAEITIAIPDNLTTWELDVRGLTSDTFVGQTKGDIITTKDLLVRPVNPRFLVAGDHTELAAVVHNNTGNDLIVDVSIRGTGFKLDDPNTSTQNVSVPAGGRVRTAWWGLVEDVLSLDLVFSVAGGGYEDASRPTVGDIPVLRFTAPQTFGTAGVLDLEGDRLEIISLPRTFDPTGGTLQIELAPSLAAAMTAGLEALEHYPYHCTEQILSRFLPNLMAYRAIQDLGLDSPDLLARLERTMDDGIQELASRQNEDGGWGWWSYTPTTHLPEGQIRPTSDGSITAYVIFGLSAAKDAGSFVEDSILQNGVNYLLATLPALEMLSSTWQLDRLAFQYFALAKAGAGSTGTARNFFEVRDQLSPYARAFLVLTLSIYDPADERIDTLLSDLEGAAIRTATGIHWEGRGVKTNLDTPMLNTALVVYAIAQQDPASIILPEAVRYLMSHRNADGSWGSTYETAWILMALTEVMRGTGELAGDFGFSAWLNGLQLLEGQTGGNTHLTPVGATVPISDLYAEDPNGLSIRRTGGPGRLYYTAHLNVVRPAADVAPLSQGITVSRAYQTQNTDMVSKAGQRVTVKVTLTIKNDAYYLVVEDHIPAGAEILDTSLKTSQAGVAVYDVQNPFEGGWGWWYFNQPLIYDDHIAWTADYVPAGTYELSYTLVLTHPGEYQVLPARAWEFYFPEVQGNSAGSLFVIEE